MIRGTTPTLTFTLPFKSSDIKRLWITFSQKSKEVFTIEKDDCTFEEETIKVLLTQEQTLKLESNCNVEIQLRILDNFGVALASQIIKTPVQYILKEGEI